jgi:hypothetical protein
MELYFFTYLKNKNIISREIITDIEEKEKTYVEKRAGSKIRIHKKSELDTLLGYDTDYPFMISLNGNPEYFLTKITEWKKNKIYEIEKMLAKEKNDLIVFNKHYEEYSQALREIIEQNK